MSTYRKHDDRLYRITGASRNGIVTAEYKRGEVWREVINLSTLALLTVKHTGTLPEGYPDSCTRTIVLPGLVRDAAALLVEETTTP